MTPFAALLRERRGGVLPALRKVDLSRNRIGAPSIAALAEVLRECDDAVPSLESLNLFKNEASDAAVQEALQQRRR